ncbi:TPA_exp: putative Ran-interacting protein Mog1 [Trichophyton benhamiae CBS 112371]|nr:TPA_exp: putative Ran-interacting protein Mog1 [Trichophyton benhamiae CBS 112371]
MAETTADVDTGYELVELYGGAMKVLIPKGFANMGSIYPIPDNQEVFRSTSTKTNIIIELVERLEPGSYTLPEEVAAQLETSSDTNKEELSAVLYHLHDMCTSNGDTYEILDLPKPYPVQLIPSPAYTCQALVTAKGKISDTQRLLNMLSDSTQQATSTSTSTSTGTAGTTGTTITTPITEHESTSTCHFFLVRLAQYGTDILVYINVPHDMLEESGVPGAVAQEEMRAHDIMANMMRSLGIIDYSLFGG